MSKYYIRKFNQETNSLTELDFDSREAAEEYARANEVHFQHIKRRPNAVRIVGCSGAAKARLRKAGIEFVAPMSGGSWAERNKGAVHVRLADEAAALEAIGKRGMVEWYVFNPELS